MLNSIAFIAAATALSTQAAPLLPAQAAWWERVDVTLNDKGSAQACEFRASHARTQRCNVVTQASMGETDGAAAAVRTKLVFERKFFPGDRAPGTVETDIGDTLIGAHMMELTIDPSGAVSYCKVVAAAGESPPDFDCDEARSEKYAASGKESRGYMTVTVSAHREQIV